MVMVVVVVMIVLMGMEGEIQPRPMVVVTFAMAVAVVVTHYDTESEHHHKAKDDGYELPSAVLGVCPLFLEYFEEHDVKQGTSRHTLKDGGDGRRSAKPRRVFGK
uniref:Secreted protein n=1 Tax=Graphocephala atropunctata TaxID=36148 RepID=A0A1B6MPJ9_9HEMI